MSRYLIAYGACAIVFFPLDFIWLSTMNQAFYRPQIGSILLENPNLTVAGLFYLAYLAGMVLLVVHPATSLAHAALLGAVLGFVAYGTYDLTNLSTVKGFTPTVAIVDMVWGTILSAVTAVAGYWAMTRFSS